MQATKQGIFYLLIVELGEELITSLTEFVERENIAAASLSAIGALRDFELGYYYLDRKEYKRKKFAEIAELVSCSGNIASRQEKPFAHLHVAMGREDFSLIGGHLFAGIVAVTAEIVLTPLPQKMERTYDEQTGLYLLSSASGKAF